MADIQKKITAEKGAELRRLLMNGDDWPEHQFNLLTYGPQKYLSASDLVHWLSVLSEKTMSDQKQEAYRGLRDYLYELTA